MLNKIKSFTLTELHKAYETVYECMQYIGEHYPEVNGRKERNKKIITASDVAGATGVVLPLPVVK